MIRMLKTENLLEELQKRLTTKQIKFATLIAQGERPIDAWEAAELGERSDRSGQMRLYRSPAIQKYIMLLNKKVGDESILSLKEIDKRLSDMATTNILDVVQLGEVYYNEHGERVQPILLRDDVELTEAQKASIKKIKSKDGSLEVELHDQAKALEMLIKRRGGFKEVQNVNMKTTGQVIAFVGDNKRGPKE